MYTIWIHDINKCFYFSYLIRFHYCLVILDKCIISNNFKNKNPESSCLTFTKAIRIFEAIV